MRRPNTDEVAPMHGTLEKIPRFLRERAWPRVRSPGTLLWLAVLLSTALGFTGFNRFGEGWDQQYSFRYGEDALENYGAPAGYWESYDIMKHYGPVYLMFAHQTATYLYPVLSGWTLVDARHLVNHLTFQVATVALFVLCRRQMSSWAALFAALLFASQPVLFGHSFINEKDAPFMAFFLLAVVSGLAVGDLPPTRSFRTSVSLGADWRAVSCCRKTTLAVALLGAVLFASELLVFMRFVLPSLQEVTRAAYRGESVELVNRWFALVATQAGSLPPDYYVQKMTDLYLGYRLPLVILAFAPAIVMGRRIFLGTLRALRGTRIHQGLVMVTAAVCLGLAMSIRVLGVAAAGLVALVLLWRKGRRALPVLVLYGSIGATVCYLTWPYLHGSPFSRFWESLLVMGSYPHPGGVLYRGASYDSDALPWHYLPFLMLVQFTLPAVILGLAGIALAARRAWRGHEASPEGLMMLLWLVVPITAIITLRSVIYDNFRQLLFATPPLFGCAGLTADVFLARVRRTTGRAALTLLAVSALASGILGILRLHPYEYIYYNALIGGVRGAYQHYGLDYWCTSNREAMEAVNRLAPPNAEIAVFTPEHSAAHFARPDLTTITVANAGQLGERQAIYGIACAWNKDAEQSFFPFAETVYQVTVEGAVLAVVRDLRTLVSSSGE
jgi:4-amino-4-deoxy-L-arabinose transferase-like glycosyltransferase